MRDLLISASDKRLKTLSLVGRCRFWSSKRSREVRPVCGDDMLELIVLFSKLLWLLMEGGCKLSMRFEARFSCPSIASWEFPDSLELSFILMGVGVPPLEWELAPSEIICWGRDAIDECSTAEDWRVLSLLGDRSMIIIRLLRAITCWMDDARN